MYGRCVVEKLTHLPQNEYRPFYWQRTSAWATGSAFVRSFRFAWEHSQPLLRSGTSGGSR